MSHYDFQLAIALVLVISSFSFVVLSAIPRTRTQGLIGLVGSASLVFAVFRGELFRDIPNMIAFEIVGCALVLASAVVSIKRRYS